MRNYFENKTKKMTSEESKVLEGVLEKYGKLIEDGVNTQLKVYCEQILYLCIYARQMVEEHQGLLPRLRLIHEIKESLDCEQDIKQELVSWLNSGIEVVSFTSKVKESYPDIALKVERIISANGSYFQSFDENLFYTCSQLSSVLFKSKDILNKMIFWLDSYSKEGAVRSLAQEVFRRKYPLNRAATLELKLGDFDFVTTDCFESGKEIYEIINEYSPEEFNHEIEVRLGANHIIKQKPDGSTMPGEKVDWHVIEEINNPNNVASSRIEISFDARLKNEGDREVLMKHIENKLFEERLVVASPRGRGSKKAVLLSDLESLNKWHKNTKAMIKRLDQIPRYVASIIEFDLKINDPKYKDYQGNRNSWYEYVTSEISGMFGNDGIMSSWSIYEEKATLERFKKKINYLKFGLKAYQSMSDTLCEVRGNSSSYPFQSTTLPPLWKW